jgi:hypothetical protein
MQTYKFDAHISKDGIITLPFEPALFNREVEITIVPKRESPVRNMPDRYMTLEEFRLKSKASLTEILHEHGID